MNDEHDNALDDKAIAEKLGIPALDETAIPDEPEVPPNRAQRRAIIAVFKKQLALTARQRPVINPTILSRRDRRRRKQQLRRKS